MRNRNHQLTQRDVSEIYQENFRVLLVSGDGREGLKRIWYTLEKDTGFYSLASNNVEVGRYTTIAAAAEAYNDL